MHIKKLEICGFKSFVDRTVIHFDHDVIGVVGPNGCGKSNIVDAIRWCMGEQSARHLRGKSMEDVIFNGSESRGPHSMAEVTLTFDNSDLEQAAALPVEYRDYGEIAVTRRLYRDGTSEYLLNKAQVRLKDVIDVFLGTGVGTKAYSIVEQGKIGLIVSARAEDRRALIEEAAGITKYKSRKKISERKMELTEQNLLRVGDRVGELERNVSSLRRQAAKAERYIGYRGELERLMLHAASHKLLETTAREKFAAEARGTADQAVQAVRAELELSEVALETAKLTALALEQSAEQAQKEAFTSDNDVRSLEGEMARARDRLDGLKSRFAAARTEQESLGARRTALQAERDQIASALGERESEEAREAEGALAEHERLDALRAEEQAAERALSEIRHRQSQASSQVASSEAKLAGFDRRTAEMLARQGKLESEAQVMMGERAPLDLRRSELLVEATSLRDAKEAATVRRVELDAELTALRAALLEAERRTEATRAELSEKKARLRALEEMHERLEGASDGVKHLMAQKDPALVGLVVDRLQVPPELTAAVTGLLGDSLECVVTDDAARGLELLLALSADKAGRASIIPRSPRRVVSRFREELEGPGVLGPLLDRLSFEPADESLVQALLGDAILVESASVALALSPLAQGRPLVALDGTVVHPDGRISGGSGDAVVAGLVDQQREMRTLRDVCGELGDRLGQRIEEQKTLRDQRTETGAKLEEVRAELHRAELALVSTEQTQKRTEDRLAALDRRGQAVTNELGELERLLVEARVEHEAAVRVLEEGRAVLAEAQDAMAEATERAAAWRGEVAAQLAIVTERKVRLARVREQVASSRATVERLSRSVEELIQRLASLETELHETATQQGELSAFLMMTAESLGEAVNRARTAQAALSDARRVFDEARLALGHQEASIKDLRAKVSAVAEELSGHEMTLQRLSIEMDHLLAGVREKFRGLDLRRVVGDYHALPPPDEEHSSRIQELTHLIDRMGPVNLDATTELAEEEKRFIFFTEQKADLEKALDDLRRAIAQMNKESKRLFRETFDAINERFKVLFPKMFRGGRAELSLTNNDDLLETGIDIVAQPPGKKLGNIELMSGGEKALTAVSLIFAIFQHKPSPFCVLDEVDAPLDEANVTRYNELIREMTDRSQFIVITHIKRTMQSVDVLYGVTMQEAGISRLVSVKVNESAQRRSGVPAAEQVAVA